LCPPIAAEAESFVSREYLVEQIMENVKQAYVAVKKTEAVHCLGTGVGYLIRVLRFWELRLANYHSSVYGKT
jgi:hypothetical protein